MKQENKVLTLREARIKAGLTMKELADKSGLTWSTVQAIETGRTPGTITAKLMLANALDMTFKQLWPKAYKEISELMATGGFRQTKKE